MAPQLQEREEAKPANPEPSGTCADCQTCKAGYKKPSEWIRSENGKCRDCDHVRCPSKRRYDFHGNL